MKCKKCGGNFYMYDDMCEDCFEDEAFEKMKAEAARGMMRKLTLRESHKLAESIIGKLTRRGYITESRKNEKLLKQIIVQHFYELK